MPVIESLFRALGRLPLPVLHVLGACLGGASYCLSGAIFARTRNNVALAYPRGAPPFLGWRSALSAGRGLMELPWMWSRPIEEVAARMLETEGMDLADAAHARGEPVLLLTPHLGCFEIAAQYYGLRHPITVLYRRPRRAELAPLMEQGRVRGRMCGAPADAGGVRQMLKALKRGEAVGMLPDQVPQFGEGMWADFFDEPAYTMTLAARLSEVKGVNVFMAYARRLPGARYRLVIRPLSRPLAEDLPARVRQINEELEILIRECPEQYLWSYNRYKRPEGVSAPQETA